MNITRNKVETFCLLCNNNIIITPHHFRPRIFRYEIRIFQNEFSVLTLNNFIKILRSLEKFTSDRNRRISQERFFSQTMGIIIFYLVLIVFSYLILHCFWVFLSIFNLQYGYYNIIFSLLFFLHVFKPFFCYLIQ